MRFIYQLAVVYVHITDDGQLQDDSMVSIQYQY